jgi:hypothetical protein
MPSFDRALRAYVESRGRERIVGDAGSTDGRAEPALAL